MTHLPSNPIPKRKFIPVTNPRKTQFQPAEMLEKGHKNEHKSRYFRGLNTKMFKNVVYEDGFYESIVVSIGEAKGDNWWCVLFPPLCLLEGEDNDTSDVEYQFFVTKMLEKIFS